MTSIVNQLAIWVKNNAKMLREKGVQVVEKIPEPGSNLAWKASIGLIYNDIIISYTIWERSGFQTELIIMNALTQKTIVMDDKNPEDPRIVHADLDRVITQLLDNTCKEMEPDPKLTVT